MKIFNVLGLSFGSQLRRERLEKDIADLSTFSSRPLMTIHPDAIGITPPPALWPALYGPVSGRFVKGTLETSSCRFLLRMPEKWNGRLVVTASPGISCENACDIYWSDYLISRGFAFACTDKGIHALTDGDDIYIPCAPENGIANWYKRFEALALTAKEETEKFYGRKPEKTYAVGISNGGYLTRLAAERGEGIFDGGLDVSGVFWRSDTGGLMGHIPAALNAMKSGAPDRKLLEAAGYPADPQWDALMGLYSMIYWESSLAYFLRDLDPGYAGTPAEYNYRSRPAAVKEAVRGIENSGDLKMPLISLSGGLDYLIPKIPHAVAYKDMVSSRGKQKSHRLYIIERGTHVDKDREFFPTVDPLMPHAHKAFELLTAWVEKSSAPPETLS
jgi:hypothetical protein